MTAKRRTWTFSGKLRFSVIDFLLDVPPSVVSHRVTSGSIVASSKTVRVDLFTCFDSLPETCLQFSCATSIEEMVAGMASHSAVPKSICRHFERFRQQ